MIGCRVSDTDVTMCSERMVVNKPVIIRFVVPCRHTFLHLIVEYNPLSTPPSKI